MAEPRAQERVPAQDGCRTLLVTQHCPPAMRKRDVWRIDQFHLLKKVGSGYASTVYLGTCRTTGNQVAIKLYHKNKLSELNFFQVSREIRIHGGLDHKNIIQLWASFEDNYGIYLVSEYASKGDVFTEVERRGGQLTEAEAVRQVLHPFLLALDYLHSNHVIHRDIKPENLLFTATGTLKVADFGLSINFEQERPVTRVGTLDYMAPEVVICPDKHKPTDHKELTHLHYTPLVDAWAVGVLAYELCVGRPPFDKGNKKATIQEIMNGIPFLPPWLSEGAVHFIKWTLTKDTRMRPSVQQLAEHPWITGHLKLPVPRNRLVGRTDSFVEPRTLGMMRNDANGPARDSGPDEVMRHLQVHNVQQSGRMLGHSTSLSALDGMRWRDVAVEAVGDNAYNVPAGTMPVQRHSDGSGAGPRSGRPSAAVASPRVSNLLRTPVGSSSGNAMGVLPRTSSFSRGVASPVPNGMASRDHSPQRVISREELLASLQSGLSSPTSGSRLLKPSMSRSFTATKSPGLGPSAYSAGGAMPQASGGSFRSQMLNSAPDIAVRSLSKTRSFYHTKTTPVRPSPLQRNYSNSPSQHASSSQHALVSNDVEAVRQDLYGMRVNSETTDPSTYRSLGVGSSSHHEGTNGRASAFRPQPPSSPKGDTGRTYAGVGMAPSRLSTSFTMTTSPMSSPTGAQAEGTASRLGRQASGSSSPAGSVHSISSVAAMRSQSFHAHVRSMTPEPIEEVAEPVPSMVATTPTDVGAAASSSNGESSRGILKGAKGLLGSFKKVFS